MTRTVLWDYPKSSASYRVRIALNLAGEKHTIKTVDLLAKEQQSPAHLVRNPQGLVPVLDIDGHRLTQSLAILDYLDHTRGLGLLPQNPAARAKVQALAHTLAIDVHPVCNLSVVTQATGGQEPARTQWMRRFIRPGLEAFEARLEPASSSVFATGDRPGFADVCLIPQLYNASRWGIGFDDLPRIQRAAAACAQHPAFVAAHPD